MRKLEYLKFNFIFSLMRLVEWNLDKIIFVIGEFIFNFYVTSMKRIIGIEFSVNYMKGLFSLMEWEWIRIGIRVLDLWEINCEILVKRGYFDMLLSRKGILGEIMDIWWNMGK